MMSIKHKKSASVLFVLAAALSPGCDDHDTIAHTSPSDPPVRAVIVQLIPAKVLYAVGETVIVNVVIDEAENVASVPFHLRFNDEVLHYIPPAIEGPFMGSDGAETVFLCSELTDGGELVVGMSRVDEDTGMSGAGLLATFQFMALAPGSCGFAFTGASVKDPQSRNLPAAFNTAPVSVQ